ncbi:MAG TPA: hypothetical protein VIF09_12195 [Polyangiaceae bacterium]|jgi:predicted esterase
MARCARLALTTLALVLAACGGTNAGTLLPAGSDVDASPAPSNGGSSGGAGEDASAPLPPSHPPPVGSDAGVTPPAPGDASAPSSDGGSGTSPAPTGACPTLASGDVTFAPAGIPARKVALSMTDAAKTLHGPLVFYWHGTGSSPAEAAYALGSTLAAIEAAGGIVAAPYHDPNAGQFPWYLVGGTKTDDLLVADEVLACVAASLGIDRAHVHSIGFSAGGLQTTAMSYLRSSYLASVVTFSGGLPQGYTPTSQDPANKFAALIFDGGSSDNAFGFDFQAASQLYATTLKGAGQFSAICNHGGGHSIPTDAAPSIWAFFQANGFGVYPSPYVKGLPSGFPSYCTL